MACQLPLNIFTLYPSGYKQEKSSGFKKRDRLMRGVHIVGGGHLRMDVIIFTQPSNFGG